MNPSATASLASSGSIARRVALWAVAMLAVVLVGISVLMAVVAEGRSRDRIVLWAADKAQSVADSVDAFDATARLLTERTYRPFRDKFPATFELDATTQQLHPGTATAATATATATVAINGDFALVDAFHRDTGGVATVFMRQGEDFERVTTSLKKENGERAMGTLLARDHPAYPLMLEGKTYTGRAKLFGKHYMTHYEAVKNAAGQVVGILFIGFDIGDFQTSLDKLVTQARFYERGGTYVIDPRKTNADAVFVAHPSAAGQKVLEAFPQAGPLLDQLRASEDGFVAGGPNLFDAQATQPWRVKRHTNAGGWWVVAEVSDDEAMATHWATIYAFWALLGAATVILGVGLYGLVRRQISAPLGELTRAVTSVAQGDLSQALRSDRRDEIGRLVHEIEGMRQRFVGMMRELRTAADGINSASSEIASGNQDLSVRTEQAASSLQETAASMEELTSTVRNSADAARQANQLAVNACEVAVRGGQVVSQVVATMQDIHRSSQKINDIIGTIDGIAFQTNILALNAAVEAARAGEQGRGFAVVAAEVRNLAQRSAEAAKEIKGLIGASVNKVETGTRLVGEAGQTMGEIVGSIQRVTDIVGEITAAAGEQSEGIGQVNVAVNQLDQMTQQNAALVQESAAAAESLKEQAERLAQVVAVFRLDASASVPAPASTPMAALVRHSPAKALGHTGHRSATGHAPKAAAPVAPAPKVAKTTPVPASGAEGDWESF